MMVAYMPHPDINMYLVCKMNKEKHIPQRN